MATDELTAIQIEQADANAEDLHGPGWLRRVYRSHESLRADLATVTKDLKEMTGCRDHAVMQRERYWKNGEKLKAELTEARAEIERLKSKLDFITNNPRYGGER